jgi:alpha-galactosidase/6-phospho-beta-glucosidase family protein
VETQAVAYRRGVTPLAVGPLPTAIHAVLIRHVDNQELIVEAAMKGDRKLALQALFNDPLVNNLENAHTILDELLAAHAEYLPRFNR